MQIPGKLSICLRARRQLFPLLFLQPVPALEHVAIDWEIDFAYVRISRVLFSRRGLTLPNAFTSRPGAFWND
jgi:hypothetical protein